MSPKKLGTTLLVSFQAKPKRHSLPWIGQTIPNLKSEKKRSQLIGSSQLCFPDQKARTRPGHRWSKTPQSCPSIKPREVIAEITEHVSLEKRGRCAFRSDPAVLLGKPIITVPSWWRGGGPHQPTTGGWGSQRQSHLREKQEESNQRRNHGKSNQKANQTKRTVPGKFGRNQELPKKNWPEDQPKSRHQINSVWFRRLFVWVPPLPSATSGPRGPSACRGAPSAPPAEILGEAPG